MATIWDDPRWAQSMQGGGVPTPEQQASRLGVPNWQDPARHQQWQMGMMPGAAKGGGSGGWGGPAPWQMPAMGQMPGPGFAPQQTMAAGAQPQQTTAAGAPAGTAGTGAGGWPGYMGGAFPWSGDQYANAPWMQGGWPQDPRGSAQAMQWMNTFMPWYQQQAQMNQFQQGQDWREAMDTWSMGFQGEQFDWQQQSDLWSQGFQGQQLAQQKALEDARRQAEEGMANVATFGRRWRPQTRWM